VMGYTIMSLPVLLAGAGLRRQAERHCWLRWGLAGLALLVLSGLVGADFDERTP
jgi:hypothetical protein